MDWSKIDYATLDENGRRDLCAKFLIEKHLNFSNQRGRVTTAAEFARWLGVANTSLSMWFNRDRLPTGNNLHKLARKLGPLMYDIVGEPRRTPEDPLLHDFIDAYYEMDEDLRREALRTMREAGNNKNAASGPQTT